MKTRNKPVPEFAESMAAAFSLWGISVREQRRSKAGGCKAFRGSRVFREPLVAWLKANPPAPGSGDAENLRAAKLRAQIGLLELQIARERGDLCEREIVREFCGGLVSDVFQIVARHVPDRESFNAISRELKAKIAGRGEVGREHL
jgi:hypothetical protein